MSDFEIEGEGLDLEYGEEIMNTGWNPDIALVKEQLQYVPTSEQMIIPDDLATVAAEVFLRKMYSYQR
ncbi:MAG: hypothetical protein A2V79_07430 [Betaproteobacteria bacterium RBG_16_56_24]|nr:MAG: hypothetical protein A2V79_07430 [Betaproteobacteria bacterium RBG_16_56_24]